MKRKRESEGNMMEEAIEKASQLINLLQRENTELKRKLEHSEKELRKINIENEQLKALNREMEEEFTLFETSSDDLKSQLERLSEELAKCQDNLKRKTMTNKELHEKISVLNMKLKEKNKSSSDEKTKMMSLQNENQYLLKKLKEYEDKENLGMQKINHKYVEYESQIKEILRIKQAFARRCEELKADNLVLTQKAAEYKQKLIETELFLGIQPRALDQLREIV